MQKIKNNFSFILILIVVFLTALIIVFMFLPAIKYSSGGNIIRLRASELAFGDIESDRDILIASGKIQIPHQPLILIAFLLPLIVSMITIFVHVISEKKSYIMPTILILTLSYSLVITIIIRVISTYKIDGIYHNFTKFRYCYTFYFLILIEVIALALSIIYAVLRNKYNTVKKFF